MKISITGSTGFVGSHLIRHLAAKKHTVTAYGRKKIPHPNLARYAQYKAWDIETDSPEPMDADICIHSAGYVDFWGSYETMRAINIEGTKKVMEAAKGARHFIYISTASVYGGMGDRHQAIEESGGVGPYSNNYARTKAAAEQAVLAGAKNFGQVTILRPHAIYGSGDRVLIPRILNSIRGKYIPIIGSGTNKFSITHVGNLCQAVSLVITEKESGGNIYNIADYDPVSVNNIYTELLSSLKLPAKIVHIPPSLAYSAGFVLEKIYLLSQSKTPPLITADIAQQLIHESTICLDKIKKTHPGYASGYSYRTGFIDLKLWIDSIGGVDSYLSKPIDPWEGKLFTY